jgi:hypothetical protein
MSFSKILTFAIVGILVGVSITNTLRTREAIMDVDEFFIRARTVQSTQIAADRANRLLEDQIYQNKDLRAAFKEAVNEYQRLSFVAADARIEADMYLQMIHGQNEYIAHLQGVLQDNNLPVPAQPKINLEPQVCPAPSPAPSPAPNRSAGNSFNSQRPMTQWPNVLPTSPVGLSQKNLMVLDVSGTVGLLVA